MKKVGSALVLLPFLALACGASADDSSQASNADTLKNKGGRDAGAHCTPTAEVCDGKDNDCNGIADDGVAGCDVCAPHLELPVETHYSAKLGGRDEHGVDQANILAGYDTSKAYQKGTCYPYYADGRQPGFNAYVGDTWSTQAISDQAATSYFNELCQSTGMPFRFLRSDAIGTDRIKAEPGAVQVIHSVVIDGSLATIVLPANWNPQHGGAGYPIIANGYYDINENVFEVGSRGGEGRQVLGMVANSTSAGRTGAIGVMWNGGGGLASYTLNERAQDQFAAVIAKVAKDFGGDPQRIVMFGTSRGGGTSLTMASNPKGHPYRVTYVAAAVPPTRIGEHAVLRSPTFPAMLDSVGWTTGFQDAWRTGWTVPACGGNPLLTGKSGVEAQLYALTGTTDPAEADANRSLVSPRFIDGLKRAGTAVHLEVGSHDFIVPYAHQVEYGLKLLQANIPLEAEVMIRAGHFRRRPDLAAWNALQAYVDPARAGQAPTVTSGISYYRVDREAKQLVAFTPSDAVYPFTLEGPRFVAAGSRFPLVMVGAAGTAWEVTLTTPGLPPYVWSGTISEESRSIQWVDVLAKQQLGDYAYGLRIKKPGKDWQVIPRSNSIDGSAASITLVAAEPNVGAGEIVRTVQGGTISGIMGTNWGLSEY
jgi:acetyl esterase/lipase